VGTWIRELLIRIRACQGVGGSAGPSEGTCLTSNYLAREEPVRPLHCESFQPLIDER